jgi:hypothetical protein
MKLSDAVMGVEVWPYGMMPKKQSDKRGKWWMEDQRDREGGKTGRDLGRRKKTGSMARRTPRKVQNTKSARLFWD